MDEILTSIAFSEEVKANFKREKVCAYIVVDIWNLVDYTQCCLGPLQGRTVLAWCVIAWGSKEAKSCLLPQ